ncbi:hypothetical protein D9M70_542200 [compost metagenome]
MAGDDLRHHFALRHGAVRQHRLAGDVADRVDAAHGRPALVVDADEAAGAVEVDLLQAEAFGHRLAADGDENLFGGNVDGATVVLGMQAAGLGGVALGNRLGEDFDAELA